MLPGAKKNIGHAALFVKDDLLKTDYGASKENFDYFTVSVFECERPLNTVDIFFFGTK